MYLVYQVINQAEDGEYVISEWQTEQRAYDEATKEQRECGEGQKIIVRTLNRGF